ncbi:MAG: hypothetical protein EOO39_04580 [Cytophagaceae bacterium]|nr:MAG: hypothetical protein EOO39_04580 [Cytophagaceae bacterium]
MIIKLLRLGFLVLSGALFVVALSPPMQRWLDQHGFIPNQYSYGDLYNMSNLPEFKETDIYVNGELTDADKPTKRYPDVDVYTLGDSFTNIDTSFYAGHRNFHRWVGNKIPLEVTLDTTKKNILVVQIIERVLQERMYSPEYEAIFINGGFVPIGVPRNEAKQIQSAESAKEEPTTSWLLTRFGTEINQRIEFVLFNGPLAIRFKEAKAELLFKLFGRTAGTAASRDKKHLFYKVEMDSTTSYSSFYPIADKRLDTLVSNVNAFRRHYLQMGFKEVYLCLVPNKATILDPTYGTYNHQIERLENNPRLEAPIISTIDTLRQHPDWYHLGDGHWNRQGKKFWLRQVNQKAALWSSTHHY